MLVPVLRCSRGGVIAACLFLLLPVLLFLWIYFIASKNPADSGESGILMLPFMMPWITMLPDRWLGLYSGWACILFNALLVYGLFGGLRFRRRHRTGR